MWSVKPKKFISWILTEKFANPWVLFLGYQSFNIALALSINIFIIYLLKPIVLEYSLLVASEKMALVCLS